MPARKSDHRKSDPAAITSTSTSTARFALKEDDDAMSSPAAPSPSAPRDAPNAPNAPSQPQSQSTSHSPSEATSSGAIVAAAPTSPSAPLAASTPKTAGEKKDGGKAGKDKTPSSEKEHGKGKDGEKDDKKDAVTIEDLNLPKSIITRLAKGVLAPNTQIQANAVLALSKSATVFISYLASHANENTLNANKKTITPADVFKALDEVELSFLKEPLEAEFAKFNAVQTQKRTSYKQKRASTKPDNDDTEMHDSLPAADTTTTTNAQTSSPSAIPDDAAPRATKKARVDPTGEGEEIDDAETEDEEHIDEDDEEEEEDEVEEDDGEEEGSGDETQDALEDRGGREEGDEALDGDDSD